MPIVIGLEDSDHQVTIDATSFSEMSLVSIECNCGWIEVTEQGIGIEGVIAAVESVARHLEREIPPNFWETLQKERDEDTRNTRNDACGN